MKIVLATVAAFFIASPCLAQTLMWEQLYQDSQLWGLTQRSDDRFLAVGDIATTGNYGLLWCFDRNGNTVWEQIYTSGNFLNEATTARDGGLVAVGSYLYPAPPFRFQGWVLRTDSLGIPLWQHFYGDPEYSAHYSLAVVCQDSAGNYVAGGVGDWDWTIMTGKAWALKFNDQGDTLWSRVYDLGWFSAIGRILALPGGDYIAITNIFSTPEDTIAAPAILKISSQGDTVWTKQYDFPTSTGIQDVKINPSGGFVGVGSTLVQTNPSVYYGWFAHFDENGDTLDFHVYPSDVTCGLYSVSTLPPDNWIMAGTKSDPANGQAWVQLCNNDGEIIWSDTLGGPDGDWADAVVADDSGHVYVAGSANYAGSGCAGWIFKLDTAMVAVGPSPEAFFPSSVSLVAFPNPCNTASVLSFSLPMPGWVRLELFDLQGRIVTELVNEWMDPGQYQASFDGSDMPSGIYVWKLKAPNSTLAGKIVLLK